jgi:hypothetical protein
VALVSGCCASCIDGGVLGCLGCRPDLQALIAWYALTRSVGTAPSWATGKSLLLVTLSSGAMTWVELRNNPLDDTERGEWTNKMLFYGLVCVINFIVACLYLSALYVAS